MGVKERRLRERLQRSQEIIDAAENVLFSKGILSATMDDIAKEAELGKATLYVYFKSKDEILLAIQERALQLLAKCFREAARPYARGVDKVKAIGRAYFQFSQDYPNYYKFISMFEAIDTKIEVEESMENVMVVNQVLRESIQVGIEDGTIRSHLRPEVLAKCLWAMSTGILQMIDLKGDIFEKYHQIEPQAFIECFFEVVNNGIEI
ncbi:MAG: TetR/AcrR family transcriptional regulator [Microscillaceae bacterium]